MKSSLSVAEAGVDPETPAGLEASVYHQRVAEYQALAPGQDSHARRIRYADALLHLGRVGEAIDVLTETEMLFPDAYLNAIYLGLAHEMGGDLRSARYWVARGIERNIEARGGSQWLNLAMLEARIALQSDRDWLRKHSVLKDNTHRTAEEILSAIRIQLAVRGDFGLEPDAVVCDLYFEAGVCASSLSARRDYFQRSLELGDLRRAEIERMESIWARVQVSAQTH